MTATGAEMMQIIAEKRRLRFISFATLVCRKQGGPSLSNLEIQSTLGVTTMGKAANLGLATRNAMTDLF